MNRTHHPRGTRQPRRLTVLAAALAAALAAPAALPAAQAQSLEPVDDVLTATATATELTVRWRPVTGAEAYLLVDERNGKVTWRGTDTTRRVSVQAPQSRSLLLFADMGERARLLGKTLAMVPPADAALDPAVAVTTAEQTRLWWRDGLGLDAWAVHVDGAAADSADATGTMVDAAAQPGVTVSHTLSDAAGRVSVRGETVLEERATTLVHGFNLSAPAYTSSDVGGDADQGDVIAAGWNPIERTWLPYETYIPWRKVDAPENWYWLDCENGDGSDYWYDGNGRRLELNSGNFKTRAVSRYVWDDAATYGVRRVQDTKRYIKTSSGFDYDSRRNAGTDGIVIRPVSNSGRDALTQVNHSVGNPYCTPAAKIDYDIRKEVHRNGGYYFYGRHDRMPNHQLHRVDRRSDGTRSAHLVFHHKLTSPYCLHFATPCPQTRYHYAR